MSPMQHVTSARACVYTVTQLPEVLQATPAAMHNMLVMFWLRGAFPEGLRVALAKLLRELAKTSSLFAHFPLAHLGKLRV